MRKWDDVTPEELDTKIEYLKVNYDPELSHKVLELFHERMQDDEHVDMGALYKLMKHVLALIIVEGRSADQAFGLKAIKGKYARPDTMSRDLRATAIVVMQMRKGATKEDAVTDAAEHMGINDRTIERACEAYQVGLTWLPDEALIQLAGGSLPPL